MVFPSIQRRRQYSTKTSNRKNMHPSAVLQMARGKGKTVPIKVCGQLLNSRHHFNFYVNSNSLHVHLLLSLQLLSSAGTGYFYTTRRNVTRTPDKFKFVKFDPIVRRRVLFTEHKIK